MNSSRAHLSMEQTKLVLAQSISLSLYMGKVLLTNKRPYTLSRFVYCTCEETFVQKAPDGTELFLVQPSPLYELRNLPENHFSLLENKDKATQGITRFKITDIEWEDGFSLVGLEWTDNMETWEKKPDIPYADLAKRFLKPVIPPKGLQTKEGCEDFFIHLFS